MDINPEIIFVLVGEGIEKKSIIMESKDKKVLNKNVYILDSVSKSDLSQLYFECDMGSSFVINVKELWANSANKYFDTLASGKPILINHEGWQKDEINQENIGYVLPAQIDDDDVKKFSNYCKNSLLIANQGENALNIAKMKYATDTAVKKYNKIFNDLL
jgi:glycosyltransferase involved in cell wall biosynthesis